jgi:HEAT repeat protein
MASNSLRPTRTEDNVQEPVDPVAAQEAANWVDQLQRTLKVSRLYDHANPTVVRFQQDLATSLAGLVTRRGALALQVGSTAISYAGHPVLTARSHDDNLAGVLHRDGIRVLTIEPGVEARELEALIGLILQVTGPAAGDDDLVALLWDANLPHVLIESAPLEGEADGGSERGDELPTGSAWPKQESGALPPPSSNAESQERGGAPLSAGGADAAASRSDDWTTGENAGDLERAFEGLEASALTEIARFQHEHETRLGERVSTGVMRLLTDCFADDLTAADREEFAAFVPRVLRESLGLGDWAAASGALRLLRACDPDWTAEGFSQELCNAFAVTTRGVVGCLDREDRDGIEAFLALAVEFGPPLAEWLMHVLAESQQMQVRRPLARTIGELLVGHPETMIPWLTDPRWYVVRNAVHILGWIGAEESANYLRVPAEHAEVRVRREVVAALGQLSHEAARPILMAMAAAAEPPLFVTIVRQMAVDDHAAVQDWLLELLRSDTVARRSDEERRALFQALATRGDAVLPALETEMNRGGLLSRRPEPDRTAIALCVARIGTPAAGTVLERGLRSGRAAVRKACSIAGAAGGTGRE